MGPGTGLVARVVWLYCMRLASSGVGGVRRVRLALLYVGNCVGVLWMFWMRLASSGGGGCIGCRPKKASRTRRTPPTPDDASRMQYSHTTRATSPGPGPIVRWPTSGAPLGSQSSSVVAALSRRGLAPYSVGRQAAAARIAVLVGGGRVDEVGGWSPGAGQWAVEGRATGAGAGAGAAVQRTRKDRVAQLDLLDDDRAHVVLELQAPGLGVGGAGGS